MIEMVETEEFSTTSLQLAVPIGRLTTQSGAAPLVRKKH